MTELTLAEALRRIDEVFSQAVTDFKHWCQTVTLGELMETALIIFIFFVVASVGMLIELYRVDKEWQKQFEYDADPDVDADTNVDTEAAPVFAVPIFDVDAYLRWKCEKASEAIITMLEVRFQTDVAEKLKPFLGTIDDLQRLDQLHQVAEHASNIDEFTQALLNLEN